MSPEEECIREVIKQELFYKEPLAFAIMQYLAKNDKKVYFDILAIFEQYVDSNLNTALENYTPPKL